MSETHAPAFVVFLFLPLTVGAQDAKQALNDELWNELLATNPVGEVLMATPAISEGMLMVGGLNHLFGIGETAAAKDAKTIR